MRQVALVAGKFAPFHKGHQLVIEQALIRCVEVVILVYSNPDFNSMPSTLRASWIKKIYTYEPVQVFGPDDPPPNAADDFTQREFIKQWLKQKQLKVDIVFGSEPYIEGFAKHLGAKFELVDPERKQQGISGTELRQNLQNLEHSEALPRLKHYLHPVVLKSLLANPHSF